MRIMPDRKRVHQTRNVNIAQQEGENKSHKARRHGTGFFSITVDFVSFIRFVAHSECRVTLIRCEFPFTAKEGTSLQWICD